MAKILAVFLASATLSLATLSVVGDPEVMARYVENSSVIFR